MRHSLFGIIALSLTACGAPGNNTGADGAVPQASVRDSLGVTIVEYESLRGAATESWRIVMSDSVRIGRMGALPGDSDYLFGRTVGSVRLSDGRIAVADRLAHSIRIFEPDGVFSESVGRRGEGPGEFTGLTGLVRVAADSILALDRGDRWTLLDPAGAFVRSGRFDLADWPGETYPMFEGAFMDGTLLVKWEGSAVRTVLPGVAMMESSQPFHRVDRFGARLADFGTFPTRTTLFVEGELGRGSPVRAWSSGLDPFHVARGTRFFRVHAGLREVHVFRIDGVLERILRVSENALEVEQLVSSPSDFPNDVPEQARSSLSKALRDLRAAIGPTPFSDFTVDEEGYMWFRESVAMNRDRTVPVPWYVFDPEGAFRTTVLLPYHWRRNLTIGADYILALERNEFSEETLLLVPLIRG